MNMPFSLKDKYALVTGGAGYLGAAMCKGLAASGATVLVNARSLEKAQPLCDEIKTNGGDARPAIFDVMSPDDMHKWVREDAPRALDILVNNAYKGRGGTVQTSTDEDYRESYEIGLVASQRLVKAMLPNLRAAKALRGDASIINIASMYGIVSPDPKRYPTPEGTNPPFYGALKAAVIQWTRYAAVEFGPEGIRVNAIAPGPFPSTQVQLSDPAFIDDLATAVPLGRIGQADEVSGPLAFLASSAASYVTGHCLRVDGGWTQW